MNIVLGNLGNFRGLCLMLSSTVPQLRSGPVFTSSLQSQERNVDKTEISSVSRTNNHLETSNCHITVTRLNIMGRVF